MFVSGMSATLVEFSDNLSSSPQVVVIKCVCLAALVVHLGVRVMGITYKAERHLEYIEDILHAYLRTSNSYADIGTIIILIFFIRFPKAQPLSLTFFFILVVLYLRTASELISL
jgi:hypothetical protein